MWELAQQFKLETVVQNTEGKDHNSARGQLPDCTIWRNVEGKWPIHTETGVD